MILEQIFLQSGAKELIWKLTENPVFITHRRIVHRAGVLAAMLIAGLIGFCLLLGLEGSLHNDIGPRPSPPALGRVYYGWVVALEILVLVLGGFSRIYPGADRGPQGRTLGQQPADAAATGATPRRLLVGARPTGVLHGLGAGGFWPADHRGRRPVPRPLAGNPGAHCRHTALFFGYVRSWRAWPCRGRKAV